MLIGISSLAPQVGKSTCSDYLIKNYGFQTVEMSDAIIYICKKYYGFNGDKLDPNQRLILQKIGKASKEIDPTIWLYYSLWLIGRYNYYSGIKFGVDKSLKKEELEEINKNYALESMRFDIIDNFKNKLLSEGFSKLYHGGYPQNIIISGVRSPNEADEILKLGGEVWCIRNTKVENEAKNVHAVENELRDYNKFSKIIYNDGSFDEYYKKIDEIMNVK